MRFKSNVNVHLIICISTQKHINPSLVFDDTPLTFVMTAHHLHCVKTRMQNAGQLQHLMISDPLVCGVCVSVCVSLRLGKIYDVDFAI